MLMILLFGVLACSISAVDLKSSVVTAKPKFKLEALKPVVLTEAVQLAHAQKATMELAATSTAAAAVAAPKAPEEKKSAVEDHFLSDLNKYHKEGVRWRPGQWTDTEPGGSTPHPYVPGSNMMRYALDIRTGELKERPIFQFSFKGFTENEDKQESSRKQLWVNGKMYKIPDQLNVLGPIEECEQAGTSSAHIINNANDMMNFEGSALTVGAEVEVEAKFGVKAGEVSSNVGGGFKYANSKLSKEYAHDGEFGNTVAIVNRIRARSFTASHLDPIDINELTGDFKKAVTDVLELGDDDKDAREGKIYDLWSKYGTHYIETADLGGDVTQLTTYDKKSWDKSDKTERVKESSWQFKFGLSPSARGVEKDVKYTVKGTPAPHEGANGLDSGKIGVGHSSQKGQNSVNSNSGGSDETTHELLFRGGIPNSDWNSWCESVPHQPIITRKTVVPIRHLFQFVVQDPLVPSTNLEGAMKQMSDLSKDFCQCENGGTCVDDGSGKKKKCQCTDPKRFTGEKCQYQIGEVKRTCTELKTGKSNLRLPDSVNQLKLESREFGIIRHWWPRSDYLIPTSQKQGDGKYQAVTGWKVKTYGSAKNHLIFKADTCTNWANKENDKKQFNEVMLTVGIPTLASSIPATQKCGRWQGNNRCRCPKSEVLVSVNCIEKKETRGDGDKIDHCKSMEISCAEPRGDSWMIGDQQSISPEFGSISDSDNAVWKIGECPKNEVVAGVECSGAAKEGVDSSCSKLRLICYPVMMTYHAQQHLTKDRSESISIKKEEDKPPLRRQNTIRNLNRQGTVFGEKVGKTLGRWGRLAKKKAKSLYKAS